MPHLQAELEKENTRQVGLSFEELRKRQPQAGVVITIVIIEIIIIIIVIIIVTIVIVIIIIVRRIIRFTNRLQL